MNISNKKEVIVHHDRSVEETVYMEILKKLYLFQERLRCMFLHLWCLGLRASEVWHWKENAYYQQGEINGFGVSGQNEGIIKGFQSTGTLSDYEKYVAL